MRNSNLFVIPMTVVVLAFLTFPRVAGRWLDGSIIGHSTIFFHLRSAGGGALRELLALLAAGPRKY